jgi:NADPH:quinone reductase-like Zn-dependent oxidoreductase
VAPADGKVALVPEALSLTVAASLPTASAAAYHAIQAARLDAGQTILVNGASGGVGQSAVQFAVDAGANVIATSPPDLADHLRSLGAAEVVDFTQGPTAEQVLAAHPEGIDAVIDLISTPGQADPFIELLRPGGVIISTNGALDPDALAARELRGINLNSIPTSEDLATIAEFAATGRLRVTIDAEVPLAEAPATVAHARAGHARGKTVFVL